MRALQLLLILSLLIACKGNNSINEKIKQLNELKVQQSELKDRIAALEAELKTADTTGGGSKEGKLVALTKLVPDTFNHFIEIQGRVEGEQDVTVSAETMGTITAVNVKAGDKVVKGQIMARLDDRIIRQGYDEVKSQLELANQVYQRQQNLWQQRIGSEIQYLQAKTTKEALEKRLSGIQEQMGMSLIKSPINGTVDQVLIKAGQAIAPGIPALRVVNLQALKVTAEVAESYITSIHTGNEVVLYFPDIKKELHTRLSYAGNSINRLNRTFNIEIQLESKNGEFRPNMMTVIKIVDYKNPVAFILPVSAIQKSGEGEFVYVVTKTGKLEMAQRKKIVSGQTYNGLSEIKEGLSEGDEVITTSTLSSILHA
jgi:membrane fusion protein (multidrug efflux system)